MSYVTTRKHNCSASTWGAHTLRFIPTPWIRTSAGPSPATLYAVPSNTPFIDARLVIVSCFIGPKLLQILIAVANPMMRPPANRCTQRNHKLIGAGGIDDRELDGEVMRAHAFITLVHERNSDRTVRTTTQIRKTQIALRTHRFAELVAKAQRVNQRRRMFDLTRCPDNRRFPITFYRLARSGNSQDLGRQDLAQLRRKSVNLGTQVFDETTPRPWIAQHGCRRKQLQRPLGRFPAFDEGVLHIGHQLANLEFHGGFSVGKNAVASCDGVVGILWYSILLDARIFDD